MMTKAEFEKENAALRRRVAKLEKQLATYRQEKSEERFRSLFEYAPVAYQSLDEQGCLLDVNPAYCEMLGYHAEELIGKSFGELWTPATRATFAQIFDKLKQENHTHADLQLMRQDGTVLAVILDGTIQRDEQGRFVRTHCILHDVTERKHTEEKLIVSEQFVHATIDALVEHICVLDAEGKILFVNRAWREFANTNPPVPPDYAIGCNYLDICDATSGPEAEIAHAFARGIRAVRANELEEFYLEYPCSSPQEERWFIGRVSRFLVQDTLRFVISHTNITDRKRAEHATRESEQRFASLFRSNPIAVGITRKPNLEIVEVNDAWCKLTGYTREQAIGHTSTELGLATPETLRQIRTRLEADNAMHNFEISLVTQSGEERQVLISAEPIDLGGEPCILSNLLDITERKRTEQIIRETNTKLAHAQRIAHIGSWEDYIPTGELHWSEEMYHILGFTPNTPINLAQAASVFPPEELARFQSAITAAIQNQAPYSMDYRIVRPDGSIVFIHDEGEIVRDEHGNAIWMYGTTQDITERKRAEEKVHESETRLRAVLENSHDAIGVHVNGIWEMCNPAAVRLFGVSNPKDLLGKPIVNVITPDERARIRDYVRQRMEGTEAPTAYLTRGLRADGTTFDMEVMLSNFTLNEKLHVLVILRDITERKRAEQELRETRELFQKIFFTSPIPIALARVSDRTIVDVNAAMEDLLGYSRTELAGKPSTNFNYWADPQERQRAFEILLRENTLNEFEFSFQTKTGVRGQAINYTEVFYQGTEKYLLSIFVDITARKQAEAQQVKLAERLELATRSAQMGIWDWDIQNNVVVWDERMYELYGHRQDEFVGAYETWLKGVHPDDRAASDLVSERARRGEIEYDTEFRVVLPNGSVRWLKANGHVYRDEHGVPIRMVGVNYDITERKQAEEKLRASEEKYRGLLESLDSVVATIDENGKFLYMNDIAAQWLGSTPDALIGKTMDELFPAPIASQQLQQVRQVIQENQGMVSEAISFVHGKPRWFRNSLQPIHDQHGQVTYVLLNSTDIHELKTAQQDLAELNRTLEERIRQATAEIQDLYDNAPTGYHSLDAQGKIVMINQTELNWLGYTRAELIGQPFANLFTPASLATFQANFPGFKQRGWVRDLEFELIRKDNSTFPVLVSATAIQDQDGNYVMSRTTVVDITERKKAEETMRRANQEMERAMRLKDEFMAGMSHELRTPLNAILGLSETLNEQILGPLNDHQLTSIQLIESSGRHLLALLNDILDLSKIEAGAVTLDIEPVNVPSICDISQVFIKQMAHKKRIQVSANLDPKVEWITADERRLKQMLVNLLTNAVKFTLEGGQVELRVTGDVENKIVQFCVRDTGIGIAPEDLQHLFKPFVQVDSSLTRTQEGTGLGLALVARMAEMHGGSVAVESELGKGSCFTIQLPWSPAMQIHSGIKPGKAELAPVVAESLASVPNARSPLILIVEDNETNITMLSMNLESRGYRLAIAQHGAQALEMIQAERPALILMDLQMPVLDGLEATRRLRRNPDPAIADIPVIALTALAMPGDRERAMAAGASGYLSKPVNLKQLSELINRYLKVE